MRSSIKVRGFFRAQILDKKTGRIVGDSGWNKNIVTNNGLNNACAGASLAATGSYAANYAALATGTDVLNATATDLTGRVNSFRAVTPSTVATGTARATVSFDGTDLAGTTTIGSIGLFKTNTAGSLVAGQTFTTSQFTTDQSVNATYELRFS